MVTFMKVDRKTMVVWWSGDVAGGRDGEAESDTATLSSVTHLSYFESTCHPALASDPPLYPNLHLFKDFVALSTMVETGGPYEPWASTAAVDGFVTWEWEVADLPIKFFLEFLTFSVFI